MMRTALTFALALLAACLLSPTRPNDHAGDAGTDGDGGSNVPPGDAGSDVPVPTTLGSDDVAGPAYAFDLRGSGVDTVFRAGTDGAGRLVVWRYDGPIHSTKRASDVTVLGGTPVVLASVDAIAARRAGGSGMLVHLYVSVSTTSGDAVIHELVEDATSHRFHDVGQATATGGAPGPISTTAGTSSGPDTPAILTYIDPPRQLWFGGGTSRYVVDVDHGITGEVPAPTIGGDTGNEPWLAVAPLTSQVAAHPTMVLTPREAAYGSGGSGAITVARFSDNPGCGSASCAGRVARTVGHVASDTQTYALADVLRVSRPDTEELELFAADATVTSIDLDQSPGSAGDGYLVRDLEVDELAFHLQWVALLWRHDSSDDAPLVVVYAPQHSVVSSAPFALVDATGATRLLGVHEAGGVVLLALSAHPGTEGEGCLVLAGTTNSPILGTCTQ